MEQEVLFPGCNGDHVSVVSRALDFLGQHYSTTEMRHIHTDALCMTAQHNSVKVMNFLFCTTEMNNETLGKAFLRSCAYGQITTMLRLLDHLRSAFRGNDSLSEILDYMLTIAAFNGHVEVVKVLIQEGADIDAVSKEAPWHFYQGVLAAPAGKLQNPPQTALQAALSGFTSKKFIFWQIDSWSENTAAREATVLSLLEQGANIYGSIEGSDTLLDTAIKYCSAAIVQTMIDKSPSLMDSPSVKRMAFQTAVSREIGAAAVIRVLLHADSYPTESESTQNHNMSSFKLILGYALDSFCESSYGNHQQRQSRPIHDVLQDGPGAVIKMILQLSPTMRAEEMGYSYLLQMSIAIDDRECTDLLLQRGVDVNAQGRYYGTALQCAARFGNLELVECLLGLSARVNTRSGRYGTALRAAVAGGHEKIVGILLDRGANVNLRRLSNESEKLDSIPILRLALRSPNLAIVKSLIAAGVDVNADATDQPIILSIACGLGDLAIVQLFLDNKINVTLARTKSEPRSWRRSKPWSDSDSESDKDLDNVKFPAKIQLSQEERASALHLACAKGHEDIVRVLLEYGADVHLEFEVECGHWSLSEPGESIKLDPNISRTPLQVAAQAGYVSIVRLLINAGARINHRNPHGTALSIASRENKLEVVEELLKFGACVLDSSDRLSVLTAACESHSHAIVEALLDGLPENVEEGAYADTFSAAIRAEDDSILQLLLFSGVPIPSSTLSQACATFLYNGVLMLLQHGAEIDTDDGEGGRALQVASFSGQPANVNLLLKHGADANSLTPKYGSPLQATLEGVASLILGTPPEFSGFETKHDKRKIDDLNSRRHDSQISLKELADCEHIVQCLLQHGSKIDTMPRNFGNPLHLASFIGSKTIVQQLLDKGADLQSVCDRFGTALLAALEGDSLDTAQLLLRKGIDVNHVSSDYGTALHYACYKKNKSMVHMLLDHGANPNIVSGSHGSPLSAAFSIDNTRFYQLDPCKGVVEIILRSGNYHQIQEQDFLSAVERIPYSCGEEILKLLLEHDKTLQARESVFVALIECLEHYRADPLQLLLQRDGGLGVSEAMIEAAKSPATMKVLLSHRPICRITPKVLFNVSNGRDDRYGASPRQELVRLLIDHERGMPITEAVVLTVLGTSKSSFHWRSTQNLVEVLFKRNAKLKVTASMLKAATAIDDMRILLQQAPFLKVTSEILDAVAGGTRSFPTCLEVQLVQILLAHDGTVEVPQTLLKVIPPGYWSRETVKYMELLLSRGPNIQITRDVLSAVNLAIFDSEATDEELKCQRHILKLFQEHSQAARFRSKTSTPPKEGLGLASLPHDKRLTINFIPHQRSGSSKPSFAFCTKSRTLPNEDCIILVGRFVENDGGTIQPSNASSLNPVGFDSMAVSRRHCEFWCSQGQWYVKDVGSRSGTFPNHIKLSQPGVPSKPFPVNDGDVVQLGTDSRSNQAANFRCVNMRIGCHLGTRTLGGKLKRYLHKFSLRAFYRQIHPSKRKPTATDLSRPSKQVRLNIDDEIHPSKHKPAATDFSRPSKQARFNIDDEIRQAEFSPPSPGFDGSTPGSADHGSPPGENDIEYSGSENELDYFGGSMRCIESAASSDSDQSLPRALRSRASRNSRLKRSLSTESYHT